MGGTVSVAQQHQGVLQNDLSPSTSSSSSSEADSDVDMDATQDESSSYSISSESGESFAESFAEQQSTKLMIRSSALTESMTSKAERQSQFMEISSMEEMNLIGPQLSPPPSSFSSPFPSPIIKPDLDFDTNLAKDEPLILSATSEYTKPSATLTNFPPLPGHTKEIKKATNDFMPNSPSDLCKPSYRAYKSMCEVFEEKAQMMLIAGNVRGFICCLDSSLETFPLLRAPIMKALENLGKAFDESKKSERALLPLAPLASEYIKNQSISRGGTSSLHTYENWHIHQSSDCKIKHEEEIYPYGFNPKLITIFKKCSKRRLRSERHEKYKVWRERAGKDATHVHRNPILSEDFIKECGGKGYRELEGRIDMCDMRNAAYWEITSRWVGDVYSRKRVNFGLEKEKKLDSSPLRRELRKFQGCWVSEEVMPYGKVGNGNGKESGEMGGELQGVGVRKRRLDRDGDRDGEIDIDIDGQEVEDEQKTYLARMKARRLEICNKEGESGMRSLPMQMQGIRDRENEKKQDKERESRRKERRERRDREKDRERWVNRERSHCGVTQAWIDLGVEMGRVGRWE
ncbi:predicted protein [Sclerotinia sclerotiorum 1980 UF-70]|uniref:Uncharacterized protein n=2 Tax=Sclerotinia sclerotiorum (strain ATCC 18683 / 1980 / Ss-1) TaxID=665079 RepID=A7F485_SCLS1|nr:predicted protein [Sclerotinia sclerotiorum 1980 UF-70]APA10728.1 hypothetical protein sscle_06g054980 [Sclerotinia sclerotiorum 1980 UF-70]EDN97556.1 predicted protein [Sclerotinia sclerotiorum 1980 UF-70]